jgi:hypothetical protein
VLVVENPDRFAIRLTEQISSIGSLCGHGIPMHRGRARRRGRFQISEFGLSRYMLAYVAMRAKCCRTNANHDQSDRKRL